MRTIAQQQTVTSTRRPRLERALIALEGFLAVAAASGAIGLLTGSIELGASIRRVPMDSPVLAGLALGGIVALPATVAVLAHLWRAPWSSRADLAAGAALVGWIAVQVAFIGLVSWLQPAMAALGGAIIGLAAFDRRRAQEPCW